MCKVDDSIERELRKRYPYLSAKRLDGYTDAQIARAHRVSVALMQSWINHERIKARQDPLCRSGPGKALAT